MLRYLSGCGIAIGMPAEVRGREAFDGPLTVSLGERELVIGREVARAIRITLSTSPVTGHRARTGVASRRAEAKTKRQWTPGGQGCGRLMAGNRPA